MSLGVGCIAGGQERVNNVLGSQKLGGWVLFRAPCSTAMHTGTSKYFNAGGVKVVFFAKCRREPNGQAIKA
jgi:hypothetical protein